ncbi:CD276 antigen-like isoform X3 [Chrysemys picta bellii]|uniref:CD276 antigen-like isoform X3 n=1 Tax=Chrysemys picta bellii TaxID=8478 RepID=UPI0032B2D31E
MWPRQCAGQLSVWTDCSAFPTQLYEVRFNSQRWTSASVAKALDLTFAMCWFSVSFSFAVSYLRLTGRERVGAETTGTTLFLQLPRDGVRNGSTRGGRCDMVRGRMGTSPGWSLRLVALWTLYGVAGAQPSITAHYGQDITLDCTFHHIPGVKLQRLNITWKMQRAEGAALLVHSYYAELDVWRGQDKVYRGRTQLDPEGIHKGNASLRLRAVRFQDEGSYLCYVTSELGTSSRKISLAVLRESEMESPIVAQLGQDVTLSCPFECGLNLQPLNITWKKEEAEGPDLLVHSCYNGMDTLQRQDVAYKGRTQLHPERFPQGNASLTLRRVRSQDEGFYICHVKPELGWFSVRMQVTVEGSVSDQPPSVVFYVSLGLAPLLLVILYIINKKHRASRRLKFRTFQFWSQQNQQEGRDQPESNWFTANKSEKPNAFLPPPASSFLPYGYGEDTTRCPGGSRVMKPGSHGETQFSSILDWQPKQHELQGRAAMDVVLEEFPMVCRGNCRTESGCCKRKPFCAGFHAAKGQ